MLLEVAYLLPEVTYILAIWNIYQTTNLFIIAAHVLLEAKDRKNSLPVHYLSLNLCFTAGEPDTEKVK